MTSPFPMWMVAPVIGTGCSCGGAGISVGCAAAGRIQAMAVTVRAANLNASGDNNFLKFIIYVLTLVINFLFGDGRSEEHTSELQSLMRISYAVFCLKKQ